MAKSRRTEPITSDKTARQAEKRGHAASQQVICLAQVNTHPGQTAAEIAINAGLERHVPSRRLPKLRHRGLVVNGKPRTCAVTGRTSMTWLSAKGGAK